MIRYPGSLDLAVKPTPIQFLKRTTEAFGGPEIYVKRDDLTGCGLSGNKIRKLEFVLAEAIERGADTVITCGGIQSNHARATALAAARLGLSSVLFLRGESEAVGEGNLFLDRLAGAQIRFITAEAYRDADALMAEAAATLRHGGRVAHVIPEGASDATGYFGYLRAAEEIAGQLKTLDLKMDHVVTAVGSGGTLGGLVLGHRLAGLAAAPIGINVCDDEDYFRKRIASVFSTMAARFDSAMDLGEESIEIIDGYVGEGYAKSRPEELALIAETARREGILLDPVYTGKAFFGLRDQIGQGRFRKGQRILFLHTGGLFGVFPAAGGFEGLLSVR